MARIERERAIVDHDQLDPRLLGQRLFDGGEVLLDVEPAGDGPALFISVGEFAQGLNAPQVGAGRNEAGLDDAFGAAAREQQHVRGFGEVGLFARALSAAALSADAVSAQKPAAPGSRPRGKASPREARLTRSIKTRLLPAAASPASRVSQPFATRLGQIHDVAHGHTASKLHNWALRTGGLFSIVAAVGVSCSGIPGIPTPT